jgi:hypothetical protein
MENEPHRHAVLPGATAPHRHARLRAGVGAFAAQRKHAGTLQVSVTVESVGAGGPVQDSGMGHDMDMKMPMTSEHK